MFSQEAAVTISFLPPLAVLVPALAAILVALIGSRNEKWRNFIAFLASLTTLGIVITMAFPVFGGTLLRFDTGFVGTDGLFSLKFETDALGVLFALVASFLWVAAIAHASVYMTHEENRTRFFIFLMLAEAATLGVFLVHDFFSLFIFFELMGFAAFTLIRNRAGKKSSDQVSLHGGFRRP
jgi:formate hydrogenlyase subunit 3/multisubunit Na+/H+ antiporter MnhD subunit